MLKNLIIENYKSIQYLDLPLTQMNAFIGANSCGKSNIMKALNLIIGPTYATIKSFDTTDHYQNDINNHINIEVHFTNHLACDQRVYGFRLYNDGTTVTYTALDQHGNPATYRPNGGYEIKVSNDMKSEVPMLYLNVDRQASQQIRTSQWTLYGKLLQHINSVISSQDRSQFVSSVEQSYSQNISTYVNQAEQILNQCITEQTGRSLELKMAIIDPSMVIKDLRPRIKDSNGFEVDIDQEGAGVQSAVCISIARAYAQLTGMPLILAIEEPELFLHPHACRHFYRIMKDLSQNGTQIFYTTHEESFLKIEDYQNIKRVIKPTTDTDVIHFTGNVNNFDVIKAASKFDVEINEVFFATKVVLVEGPADKIAVRCAFEKLNIDLDKLNISVIDCGSISGIKPMIEILNHFQIDCFAVVDEDPGNQTTLQTIQDIQTVLPANKLKIQQPNLEGIFNQQSKFKKKTALTIIPTFYQTNAVQQVYNDLKNEMGI